MIQPEDIPRATRPNPWNYNNLELAKKDKAVKDAIKDYPNIPEKWIDWMYDIVEHKSKEEIEKIINEGLWEKPIKTRDTGGVLQNMEIELGLEDPPTDDTPPMRPKENLEEIPAIKLEDNEKK